MIINLTKSDKPKIIGEVNCKCGCGCGCEPEFAEKKGLKSGMNAGMAQTFKNLKSSNIS